MHPLIRLAALLGSCVLWVAGAQLFVRSHLSPARKIGWLVFLVLVGVGIGLLLPLDQIWSKFGLLMLGVPIFAAADVWLFRSGRGLSFWIRACGFEICTVFGVAGAARFLFDSAGVAALVRRAG